MTGFRLSDWQRAAHDRMECSDACPACSAIDAQEERARGGRDYEIATDYEDPR